MTAFFNQYLRSNKIPVLEYRINGKALEYRYSNVVDEFDMPVKIEVNNKQEWIFPNSEWQGFKDAVSPSSIVLDKNFYVDLKKI